MTKLREVYKCNVCGNMNEMVHAGAGTMVCCGKDMELLNENTVDASLEKHVPVIEKVDGGVLVKVGSIEHPMEEIHHIEWIELHTENYVYRKFLKVGEKPEALFNPTEEPLYAREYCNLHGLWKG
ncbi:desulfoferrodoxin [Oxobacter pfennigii]|uniref:Desulfoferrodoxin n=1 Tax=Oxobacter pfennigii TaxID=36849 RepID=A0A0P9AEB3_9CLOT|nr:desulfoferrodoxin [Oxobacter pfennigii]KPU43653.1 desulfoferrodoxin [Oxobacter pfennigii]